MWKEIPPFSFSAGERKIMAHFVVKSVFTFWLRLCRAVLVWLNYTSRMTMSAAATEKNAQPSGNVARQAGVVGLAVMASRVLGLVRDQVFAAFFGAGLQYDAFLTAFRIPNLLRDLFAEGALSAAFVTTFSQVLEAKGKDEIGRASCRERV